MMFKFAGLDATNGRGSSVIKSGVSGLNIGRMDSHA